MYEDLPAQIMELAVNNLPRGKVQLFQEPYENFFIAREMVTGKMLKLTVKNDTLGFNILVEEYFEGSYEQLT